MNYWLPYEAAAVVVLVGALFFLMLDRIARRKPPITVDDPAAAVDAIRKAYLANVITGREARHMLDAVLPGQEKVVEALVVTWGAVMTNMRVHSA